jgi:non-specific serine/threonine protein kinase
VAAICRRLDFLPLAIELVAVRTRALSPADLLRQLDHPLSALTAAPRDLPERQRTLRAAIAWSYDRLAPAEQLVFRRLGVFAGGGPFEALAVVAPEVEPGLPVLEALNEASLLQLPQSSAPPGEAGPARFTLLETLREFALEQMAAHGEAEAARRHHLDYFLALAERVQPALEGPEQAHWFTRLERDHDNLRAALAHALTLGDDTALRLAVAVGKFWEVRGHLAEGRRWLAQALAARPHAPLPVRAAAMGLAGWLAHRQGDYTSARDLGEQSLSVWQQLEDAPAILRTLRRLGATADEVGDSELAQSYYERSLALAREIGDLHGIAIVLNNLGLVASDRGDDARARALFAEGLPLLRQLGDHATLGMLLLNLGLVALDQLDYREAWALMEESRTTFRAIGHKWGLALVLLNQGNVARFQDDLTLAFDCYTQSLALYRELGDPATGSYPLFGLGQVAFARGDYAQARDLYRRSLVMRVEAGENRPMPRNLDGLGQLARVDGRPERAARLFAAAAAWRERKGMRLPPEYCAEYEQELAALHTALGAAFEDAWAAGRALGPEAAVALALEA